MSDYTQQQRIAYQATSQGDIILSLGGAGSALECERKRKGCTGGGRLQEQIMIRLVGDGQEQFQQEPSSWQSKMNLESTAVV